MQGRGKIAKERIYLNIVPRRFPLKPFALLVTSGVAERKRKRCPNAFHAVERLQIRSDYNNSSLYSSPGTGSINNLPSSQGALSDYVGTEAHSRP